MPTARALLRDELTARLLPALRSRGFEGPARIAGNALVHEFRRARGELTDVLSLQLEKNGLPRFLLNLHVAPAGGLDALIARGGNVVAAQVKHRPGPYTRSWFRADPTLWQRLSGSREATPAAAVNACLAVLPEVDAWWTTMSASTHVSVTTVRYPGTASRGV